MMNLVQDFENSLGSRDELGQILDGAIGDTRVNLEESGRDRVAALVATGTFTEGLHIVSSLIDQFPKGEVAADDPNSGFIALAIPLVQQLLKQEEPMGELNTLLKSLGGDATTDQLVTLTSGIVQEYENLNIAETMGEPDAALKYLEDGALDGLIDQIQALRSYITG